MIKYLLIIIGLFSFSSCSSSLLLGSYSTVKEDQVHFAGTTIMVLPNNNITVNHWSDTGDKFGEGKYKIKRGKLHIKFKDIPKSSSNYEVGELEVNYADAYMYKIISHPSKNLHGASIFVLDEDNKLIKGNIIKENGISLVKVPKQADVASIEIALFGHTTLSIPIGEKGSKSFIVQLENTFNKTIPLGQSETYQIEKRNGKILLKRDNIECWYKEIE